MANTTARSGPDPEQLAPAARTTTLAAAAAPLADPPGVSAIRHEAPAVDVVALRRVFTLPGRRRAAVTAVDDVALRLPTGSFTALVGASGCGKSTLLQCIAGLDRPTSGTVRLLGTDITALRPRDAAQTVTAFIVASVVLATAAVLTSTAALVIAQHQRDHGLWRALGMRPGMLRAILLGQLAVVGAVGSLGGGALGWPVARVMVPLLIDQGVALPGTRPQWEAGDLIWTALVVAGAVMIGGWGPARRAARATEMELLAGRGAAGNAWSLRRLLGVLTRIALACGFAAGMVAAAVALDRSGTMTEDAINAAMLGSFAALGLVCVLAPWLVPLLERLLGLLPARGPAWLVATRTAALQSRRSAATVLPFLVAIGLVAVMFGATHAGFGNMRLSGFLAMFSLALVTAWSGGVAVIAMSASGRRRDAALLEAAGARERTVLAAQVMEGVLHAGVAVILGTFVSVATSTFMATASGSGVLATIARGPWGELGVVGGLTLVTTCLAVVLSARAGRERSVGEVLRARE